MAGHARRIVRVADDVDARAVSCSGADAPATPGCCRTSRWPRRRCCLRRTGSRSRVRPERCRAAPPANLFWVARYVERAEATLRLGARHPRRRMEAATRVVARKCAQSCSANGRRCRPTSLTPSRFSSQRPHCRTATRRRHASERRNGRIRDPGPLFSRRLAGADRSVVINAPIDLPPTESAIFERVNRALRLSLRFPGWRRKT